MGLFFDGVVEESTETSFDWDFDAEECLDALASHTIYAGS